MTDKVYYSDFNHVDLMRLHEVSPDVPTAPLYFHRLGKVWDYAGLIGASAIHPDFGQLYEVPETRSRMSRAGNPGQSLDCRQ